MVKRVGRVERALHRALLMAFLVTAALAVTVEAKFAATQGFSGRQDVDCSVCHPPVARDGRGLPAEVHVEGLPDAWEAGNDYIFTVRVAGGPPQNPDPTRPKAGFDLEVDQGTLSPGPGMEGLLRTPVSNEVTYTGNGTLRTQWIVGWSAPDGDAEPLVATFWVAGLAANGDHNPGGTSRGGEFGDETDTAVYEVPPSDAMVAAWQDRPVPAPRFDPLPNPVEAGNASVLVSGKAVVFADEVLWRVDEDPWQRASGVSTFFFYLPALDGGDHSLEAVAAYGSRTSEPARIDFDVAGSTLPFVDAEGPAFFVAIGAVAVALTLLRIQRGENE